MLEKFFQKIFKSICYEIFFRIYGKIEKSICSSEDKRIEVKTINIDENLSYRIFSINNGRLYTDRIHDTAVLLDNKIIKEPSFQLRYKGPKIYNSEINENVVFKKGTPKKLKELNGSVLSLLTGGGGNKNYWHWLFDVLPRLGLCSKNLSLNDIDYFLLPSHIEKFQIESLDCLKIPSHKRLSSEKYRHLKARKIIVTDHPTVITGDPTKDIMDMPIWISKWLKSKFIFQISNKNKKRIYIDRNDKVVNKNLQRFISNEDEIKNYLIKNNFTLVKLHEMKFIDQVKLFNEAECVVGLHGGGFANIVFCEPKTKIIELKSTYSGNPIENLAKKNNLNYSSINVSPKQGLANQQGSIYIPIKSLSSLIENFKS